MEYRSASHLSMSNRHDADIQNSMKLDKSVVQRRLDLMAAEGIVSNC